MGAGVNLEGGSQFFFFFFFVIYWGSEMNHPWSRGWRTFLGIWGSEFSFHQEKCHRFLGPPDLLTHTFSYLFFLL